MWFLVGGIEKVTVGCILGRNKLRLSDEDVSLYSLWIMTINRWLWTSIFTSDRAAPIVPRKPGEGDGGRCGFGHREPRLIWWH